MGPGTISLGPLALISLQSHLKPRLDGPTAKLTHVVVIKTLLLLELLDPVPPGALTAGIPTVLYHVDLSIKHLITWQLVSSEQASERAGESPSMMEVTAFYNRIMEVRSYHFAIFYWLESCH